MRFYARFACRNPHFHTSWYKISYDTRAKKRFLDKCDYSTRLRLVLQTHTRQKTFQRTRIVIYYLSNKKHEVPHFDTLYMHKLKMTELLRSKAPVAHCHCRLLLGEFPISGRECWVPLENYRMRKGGNRETRLGIFPAE